MLRGRLGATGTGAVVSDRIKGTSTTNGKAAVLGATDGATAAATTATEHAKPGLVPRLRFVAFSIWFAVLGFVITVVNIPTILAYPIVKSLHPLPYNFYLIVSRPWGLIQTLLFFDIQINDHDNMPKTGGIVVVANHQSNLDFMTLWHLRRRCIIMSKWEVLFIPFLGTPWSLLCGHIMVDRKDKDSGRKAIERGAELARQGYAVFVFPEGTRRSGYGGKMQEAKMGAFKMAKAAGVPIVPLTIRGTNKIMPNHGKANITCILPGKVDVFVHPPISTVDCDLESLKASTMDTIQSKLRPDD